MRESIPGLGASLIYKFTQMSEWTLEENLKIEKKEFSNIQCLRYTKSQCLVPDVQVSVVHLKMLAYAHQCVDHFQALEVTILSF